MNEKLLLAGNKRDRLETLTQCAGWSQFVLDYFFYGKLPYFSGGLNRLVIKHFSQRPPIRNSSKLFIVLDVMTLL